MSLAHAAEHLKQHGRGPDTELVHMSKKEIKGLQELAMAHGGSLTINPHTGLPETGFLDNLLPTIIGVGLSVASGGALTPLMAAGITGAGYGLATGDLNKGLMAGLGAYGGAGLGAGLSSAGAAQGAGEAIAKEAATNSAAGVTADIGDVALKMPQNYAQMAAQTANPQQIAAQQAAQQTIGGNLTQAGQGVSALGNEAGRNAFMAGTPTGTLPALGFSAVNAAAPEQKVPGTPGPDQYDKRLAGYKLADNYKAYEAPRPNPYYSAQYAQYAEGGLAMGGVSNMPPQTNFANPAAADMGTSQYSMATDPMSGNIANRMAEGGVTGSGQMQLNVPINVGGGGGDGGFSGKEYSPVGSGGGFGGDYKNDNGEPAGFGGGYAPPGGPQGGGSGLGSLTDILKGRQVNPLQQALVGPQQQQPTAQLLGPTQSPPMTSNDPSITSGAPIQRGLGGKGGFAQPADNTGKGMGFARGGHLSASASIPDTGIYSDSDLTTRGEQALGASNAKLAQLYKRAGLKYAAGPKSGIEKLGGGFSEAAAGGGLSHLGGYSDGGRMLKGPGDGMSDDIPAMIGKKQPARLADGEFVVPADVVSHLGNGSTDAGAKKLYGMMDKIRKARTGRKAQGKQINPNKFIPA